MKDDKSEKEDAFWAEGSFAEAMSPDDAKKKMRTFHMKHNEEMNFNCKKCEKKISAHNNDWHDGMCDDCFNRKYFPEDQAAYEKRQRKNQIPEIKTEYMKFIFD